MIAQILFWSMVLGIAAIILGTTYLLLPNASSYPVPEEFTEFLELIVSFMKSFDFIFPFATLFNVLGIAMAFHLTVYLWEKMKALISWTRGVGTGV